MSVQEFKNYASRIKKWIGHPYCMQFTGGEPFILGRDLFEMLQFASSEGLLTKVLTNGTLIDAAVKGGLVKAGLGRINISLDSLDPQVHDRLRGKKGAFRMVMSGLEALSASDIKITLATVLMAENSHELVDLVKFAKERKYGISLQPLFPTFATRAHLDKWWFKKNESWPRAEQINPQIDRLINMKKAGYPIHNSYKHLTAMKDYFQDPNRNLPPGSCTAGTEHLQLNKSGMIYFCSKYKNIADLNKPDFEREMASLRVRSIRQEIRHCRNYCGLLGCNFRNTFWNNLSMVRM